MLKKNRRDEILKAAISAFSEKGYHDTSITDIIENAGIARGTFYLYFENKRRIFDSILDNLIVELDHCIKKIELGKGHPNPLDQLKANLTRVITLLIENPELTRILLHHATGLDAESDQKITEFYDDWAHKIEEAVRLGIKMGLVRQCNSKLTSYCILGSIREVIEHITLNRREKQDINIVVE
ncbi:MAG: TetR/AcrR family transcriptional regulator, partial [Nitrospirae bacterium]|nr:TetR/AcrR family transcriptional regulator [Nitrospirota bacterium]